MLASVMTHLVTKAAPMDRITLLHFEIYQTSATGYNF